MPGIDEAMTPVDQTGDCGFSRRSMQQKRLRNAIAVLFENEVSSSNLQKRAPLVTYNVAEALLLSHVCPLDVYRAASCLRESDMWEVVQFLVFAGPAGLVPALRFMNIMRGLPGNWELTLELLEQQSPEAFQHLEDRATTLIALLGGRKVSHLFDWPSLIHKSNQDLEGETSLAVHMLLEKKWTASIETVFHVDDWEAETQYKNNPSVWRELKWALCAREKSIGVAMAEERLLREASRNSAESGADDAIDCFESVPTEFGPSAQHYVRVSGVMMRRRGEQSRAKETSQVVGATMKEGAQRTIITPAIRDALSMAAWDLCHGRPILLEGETGCGKTELISLLARETCYNRCSYVTESPGVTFVQMDSAMSTSDGDTFSALVGGVVPLPEGGGFRWRPGPIGLAVQRGDWLVFENLPRASVGLSSATAIISSLIRLCPGDKLSAPGGGEPFVVNRGFRCIATRTVAVGADDNSWEPPGGWGCWTRISMKTLSRDDQIKILSHRFPNALDCIERVVRAVNEVNHHLQENRGPLIRKPTLRESVRLCNRLEALRSQSDQLLSTENALLETMDMLLGWCPGRDQGNDLVNIIAAAWSLSSEIGREMLTRRRPSLSCDERSLHIGRAFMSRSIQSGRKSLQRITYTGHTLRLLERVLRCLQLEENVLLTGEAGSGKTAAIQEVARMLGKRLVVANLSRQSELSDLVGGFRPIEHAALIPVLARKFEEAFCSVLSAKKNAAFLDALQKSSRSVNQHDRAIRLMKGALNGIPRNYREANEENSRLWADILDGLRRVSLSRSPSPFVTNAEGLDDFEPARKRPKVSHSESPVQPKSSAKKRPRSQQSRRRIDFEFVDGLLSKAMRNGDWILLDEVNLAPCELLEGLVSVVDRGTIMLPNENGDILTAATGFRLFAAMNPPTDVGKRPLPSVLRTRFSEFCYGDISDIEDIMLVVHNRFYKEKYSVEDLQRLHRDESLIAEQVASFHLQCVAMGTSGRIEGLNGKPMRYSLRTLTRMLDYASGIARYMNRQPGLVRRALFEGAALAYATPLGVPSRTLVTSLAEKLLLQISSKGKRIGSFSEYLSVPAHLKDRICVIEGFPIAHVGGSSGTFEMLETEEHRISKPAFVISPTVRRVLCDVCRALVLGTTRLPIILQGPTAAGKTALVTYLAETTGNDLVRINNHEHTDLTEYIGGYVTTPQGALVFHEGPLIMAARKGSWILLDELNLAPPEVLESLNRLLDDNREILVPETGEVVKAAEGFTLFATQNPPGLYGGRKELSRAFRSRFIEIQVPDLPDDDLLTILETRCQIPSSFAKKMISVMRELQIRRKTTNLFSGRDGFVTARDLFRWASRGPRSKSELALHGFFLLGERTRTVVERGTVKSILLSITGVDEEVLDDCRMYSFSEGQQANSVWQECLDYSLQKLGLSSDILQTTLDSEGIVMTSHMQRMMTLVIHAMANSEPFLLVGATGGGKTTCCSIICKAMGLQLMAVNCHQHTEASDVLGSFRPARSGGKEESLFEWVDGPVVRAMKQGAAVLVDEINMADDAVIERLNSVLEYERTLLLSEKGAVSVSSNEGNNLLSTELIRAHPAFRIMGTMNPGGDFGKKELSPALRNRFTEVWIPPVCSAGEFLPIIRSNLRTEVGVWKNLMGCTIDAMANFLNWVLDAEENSTRNGDTVEEGVRSRAGPRFTFSVRDISLWCVFIKAAVEKCNLNPLLALVHGSRMVFLDGLSVGNSTWNCRTLELSMWSKLMELIPGALRDEAEKASFQKESKFSGGSGKVEVDIAGLKFGCFTFPRGKKTSSQRSDSYSFNAPSTLRNTSRLARAMVVDERPVLLEGPPGCGKSSLIAALAERAGFPFMRVNLSESTEMSDLIGVDSPGKVRGTFSFRHGPLLTALEEGAWLLLDELNLASQSVLEGLNSILDHRRSIYVPEMGKTVQANPLFRIFGAQNPAIDGGGRRGLPKSFLNRFTKVYVEEATEEDIALIVKSLHPNVREKTTSLVIKTLTETRRALMHGGYTCDQSSFGLRDALRWCDLLSKFSSDIDGASERETDGLGVSSFTVGLCFDVVILQGLSGGERSIAEKAFRACFGHDWSPVSGQPSLSSTTHGVFRIGSSWMSPGKVSLQSFGSLGSSGPDLIPTRFRELQALSFAVSESWPAIIFSESGEGEEPMKLVKTLANLCGRQLKVFHGAALSDFEEFVGGYVQQDLSWTMGRIRVAATHIFNICMSKSVPAYDSMKQCSVAAMYQELLAASQDVVPRGQVHCEVLAQFWKSATLLSDSAEDFAGQGDDLRPYLSQLDQLLSKLREYLNHGSESSAGSFEWRKSEFIEAIEKGEWVALLQADLCPPATLDRLNPLLERPPVAVRGSHSDSPFKHIPPIVLAEAPPQEDGSPVFMSSHSDFRLFFLCNGDRRSRGTHGLSRALLDRSLKLSMSPSQGTYRESHIAMTPNSTSEELLAESSGLLKWPEKTQTFREVLLGAISDATRIVAAVNKPPPSCFLGPGVSQADSKFEDPLAEAPVSLPSCRVAEYALDPHGTTVARGAVALKLAEEISFPSLSNLVPPETEPFKNAICEPTPPILFHSSFQPEKIRKAVIQGVAKRFLLSSSSQRDFEVRAAVLKAKPGSVKSSILKGIYVDLKETIDAVSNVILDGTRAQHDSSVKFSEGLPLDPILAGDEGSSYIFEQLPRGRLAPAANMARTTRIIVTSLQAFRSGWRRANLTSSLGSNDGSLFTRGRLACELGVNSSFESEESIAVLCYNILSIIACIADKLTARAESTCEWEFVNESNLNRLLLSGGEMCHALSIMKEEHTAELLSRAIELRGLISMFLEIDYSFLEVSEDLTQNILYERSKWNVGSKPSFVWNLPKTAAAQNAESELVAAEKCRSRGLLNFKEVDGLTKALASVTTKIAAETEGVMAILKKVGGTLVAPKSEGALYWGGLQYWSQSSLNQATNSVRRAITLIIEDEDVGNRFPRKEEVLPSLDEALTQLKCIPQVRLDSIVGLQGLRWLLDAGDSRNVSAYRETLRQSCSASLPLLLSESASASDQMGQTLLVSPTGSRVVDQCAGILDLMHSYVQRPSEYTFWNFHKASLQAMSAAKCIAAGGHVLGTEDQHDGMLLVSSLRSAIRFVGVTPTLHERLSSVSLRESLHVMTLETEKVLAATESPSEIRVLLELQVSAITKTAKVFDCRTEVKNGLDAIQSVKRSVKVKATLGEAWISLGLLRLRAFHFALRALNGVDPSDISKATVILGSERCLDASAAIAAHVIHGMCRLGGEDAVASRFVKRMKDEFSEAVEGAKTAAESCVYRPKDRSTFRSFVATVGSIDSMVTGKLVRSDLISRLVNATDPFLGTNRTIEEAQDIYRSCSTTAEALGIAGSLSHFRDLTADLLLGLREVQYGLSLCLTVSQLSTVIANRPEEVSLLSDLTLFPRAAFKGAMGVSQLVESCISPRYSPKAILACISYAVDSASQGCTMDTENISMMFKYVANIWKTGHLRKEEERERKNSLHVLREAAMQQELVGFNALKTLEENEERDYMDTFNPIQEEMENAMLGLDNEAHDKMLDGDKEIENAEEVNETSLNHDDFWAFHNRVFSGTPNESDPNVTQQPRTSSLETLAGQLSSIGKCVSPIIAHIPSAWSFFSSFTIAAQLDVDLSSSRDFENESESYNFYTSANISELRRASMALHKMYASASRIQKVSFSDIGGHPVLLEVISAITRVAKNCNLEAPLSNVVVGLEHVLRKVDEWRKLFATSDNRMEDEVAEMSQVVLKWRRLEMKSWNHLLESRAELAADRANKWFFFLFDAVIIEATSSDFCQNSVTLKSVTAVVDQFLRSSPTGEFNRRLDMIRSLSQHLCSVDHAETSECVYPLGFILRGIVRYYSLYCSPVSKEVSSSKRIIQGKLEEFAHLQSWNTDASRNASQKMEKSSQKHLEYNRLKTAAERTKRRLHKLCLEMDKVLRVPAYDHIVKEIGKIGFDDLTDTAENPIAPELPEKAESDKSTMGERIRVSVDELVQKFDEVACRFLEAANVITPSDISSSLLLRLPSFEARIRDLGARIEQSEAALCSTAGMFSEETRDTVRARTIVLRQSGGSDVQLKKRALVDLMKRLRQVGLTPFENKVSKVACEPFMWLSSPDPSQSSSYNSIANRLFYVSAQRLRRLRESSDSRTRNEDITPDEAQRSRAFCGHLFERAVYERQLLSEMNADISSILEITTVFESLEVPSVEIGLKAAFTSTMAGEIRLVIGRLRRVVADFKATTALLQGTARFSLPTSIPIATDLADVLVSTQISTNQPIVSKLAEVLSATTASIEKLILSDATTELLKVATNRFYVRGNAHIVACNAVVHHIDTLRQNLVAHLLDARTLSENNIGVHMIEATLRFVVEFAAKMSSTQESEKAMDDDERMSSANTSVEVVCEGLIEKTLLGAQKLLTWNGIREKLTASENKRDGEHARPSVTAALMTSAHTSVCSLRSNANLEVIFDILKNVRGCISNNLSVEGNGNAAQQRSLTVAKVSSRLVLSYVKYMVLPSLSKACTFHCKSLALLGTLSSLFSGLCLDGYCRPTNQGIEAEVEEGVTEKAGAGFGDAGEGDISGAQDVSEQIENEEQLIGLENDAEDPSKPKSAGDEDNNAGFEMTNEFAGDLEDIDPNDNDVESMDDNGVDERLADENGRGREEIDERLWDGSNSSPNQEKLKNEDPSRAEALDSAQSELVAKEDHAHATERDSSRRDQSEQNPSDEGDAQDPSDMEKQESDNLAEKQTSSKKKQIAPETENAMERAAEHEKHEGRDRDQEDRDDDDKNSPESIRPGDDSRGDEFERDSEADADEKMHADRMQDEKTVSEDPHVDDELMTGAAGIADEGDQQSGFSEELHESGLKSEAFSEDLSLNGDDMDDDDNSIEQHDEEGGGDELETDYRDNAAAPEVTEKNLGGDKTPINSGNESAQVEPKTGEEDQNENDRKKDDHERGTMGAGTRGDDPLDGGSIMTKQFPSKDKQGDSSGVFPVEENSNTHMVGAEPHTNERNEDGGAGVDAGTGRDQGKSDEFHTGEGEADRGDTQERTYPDPNPHRAVPDEKIIAEWSKLLRAVQDSNDTSYRDGSGAGEEGALCEFMNDGESDEHGQIGMGAATEDQQRPLPEKEKEGEDDRQSVPLPESQARNDVSMAPSEYADQSNSASRARDQDSSSKDNFEDSLNAEGNEAPDVRRHSARDAVDQESKAMSSQAAAIRSEIFSEGVDGKQSNADKRDELEAHPAFNGERALSWEPEKLSDKEAAALWRKLNQLTFTGASTLCEQLRLVLEPTIATGLAGGYRTGKRLSIRKVIEFVASDFRKDRIWLRRVRPDKRSYDVILAIDDSESMSESGAGPMAVESLALITNALSKLEIGRFAVASFGKEARMVRDFEEPLPLSDAKGGYLLQQFGFAQKETDVCNLLEFISLQMIQMSFSEGIDQIKLALVISDGRLSGREEIKKQLRKLRDCNVLVALIIVDKEVGGKNSIYDVRRVEYQANGKISIVPYMQDFPINYYAIVHDVLQLPTVLADALRQWIEATNMQL